MIGVDAGTDPEANAVIRFRIARRQVHQQRRHHAQVVDHGCSSRDNVVPPALGVKTVGRDQTATANHHAGGSDRERVHVIERQRREQALTARVDGAKTAPPPEAYDLIIDAVGSHASRHIALSAVGAGGVVIHIGLADNDGGIDVHRLTRHEITLMGAYTYTAQDLEDALHQLHRGSLGDLSWIETRQLRDGPSAFRDLDAGRIAAGKIILIP